MNQVDQHNTDRYGLFQRVILHKLICASLNVRLYQTWIQDLLIQDQDQDSEVPRPRPTPRLRGSKPRPRPRLSSFKTKSKLQSKLSSLPCQVSIVFAVDYDGLNKKKYSICEMRQS